MTCFTGGRGSISLLLLALERHGCLMNLRPHDRRPEVVLPRGDSSELTEKDGKRDGLTRCRAIPVGMDRTNGDGVHLETRCMGLGRRHDRPVQSSLGEEVCIIGMGKRRKESSLVPPGVRVGNYGPCS